MYAFLSTVIVSPNSRSSPKTPPQLPHSCTKLPLSILCPVRRCWKLRKHSTKNRYPSQYSTYVSYAYLGQFSSFFFPAPRYTYLVVRGEVGVYKNRKIPPKSLFSGRRFSECLVLVSSFEFASSSSINRIFSVSFFLGGAFFKASFLQQIRLSAIFLPAWNGFYIFKVTKVDGRYLQKTNLGPRLVSFSYVRRTNFFHSKWRTGNDPSRLCPVQPGMVLFLQYKRNFAIYSWFCPKGHFFSVYSASFWGAFFEITGTLMLYFGVHFRDHP